MLSQLLRSTRPASSSLRTALTQRGFHSTRISRDHFLDATDEVFKTRALDQANAKPVLVDFYAAWCQPCRVLTPLLKRVTGPESDYDLITLDVDQYPELAGQFKVAALPTVVAFKNGAVKNKFVGFRNSDDIDKFLGML
ncbi:thioredoxin [Cryptococcus sp. DSM 104549]